MEEAERLGLKILDEDDIKIRRTLNQICEDNSSLVKGQMAVKKFYDLCHFMSPKFKIYATIL